jgi:Carbamoyltransferase C-terminus
MAPDFRSAAIVRNEACVLGPEFRDDEIREALGVRGEGLGNLENWRPGELETGRLGETQSGSQPVCRIAELPEEELVKVIAKKIAEGKVVGWLQGRMEWGPRALGNRSILVDPRRAEMKDLLNSRIKHREPFRPFAPSILLERVGDYFEETHPSSFMLMAYKVKREKRSVIPAPTRIDGRDDYKRLAKKKILFIGS